MGMHNMFVQVSVLGMSVNVYNTQIIEYTLLKCRTLDATHLSETMLNMQYRCRDLCRRASEGGCLIIVVNEGSLSSSR